MSVMPVGPFKWCSNCAFWGGPRTLNGPFHRMEIENGQVKGPCSVHLGWTQMPYNGTCDRFEKHPGVK